MIIKISAGNSKFANLLRRQTPGLSAVWNGNTFHINSDVEYCDYWVVCHESGLEVSESAICDPRNIIYISMEPDEDVCRVNDLFLKQFEKVVTCDESRKIKNKISMNVSTWWVGIKMESENGMHVIDSKYALDYDSLTSMPLIKKIDKVSLITSNKVALKGHRQRLEAIEKLLRRPIGRYIDAYGTGFNPILDKYDAISPYKYHLIFENQIKKNYWSEKLGDAFLGLSYPIYSGCTNIENYFDKDSILEINRFDVDDMERKIESALDNDYHKKNFEKIKESKNLILNKYNLFNIVTDLCTWQNVGEKRLITLLPNKSYSKTLTKKIYWKYKSFIEKIR